MTLKIEIRCDNDAFTDSPRDEIARLLRDYIMRIEKGYDLDFKLRDYNGNMVGAATIETDE